MHKFKMYAVFPDIFKNFRKIQKYVSPSLNSFTAL